VQHPERGDLSEHAHVTVLAVGAHGLRKDEKVSRLQLGIHGWRVYDEQKTP
jgi:hypothetical protein